MARKIHSIEVEFFASLREAVGCRVLSILPSEIERLTCVEDVRTWVVRCLGESRCTELLAERTRLAVNEEFAELDTPVDRGDRVAFMPAVTGG